MAAINPPCKPDPKLAMQSAALTKQLAIDAKQKGEISKNLIIDWTELQKKIGPDDCVVEFAYYTNPDGFKSYIALFFTKKSNLKVIPLCDEKDFNLNSIDYLDPLVYNMIWKPVLDKSGSVKNIYFSPSGILHLVGLEHLSNGDATISDIYNVHRLSSTRELLSKNNTTLKSAVLYGGVNYDADVNPATADINDSNHEDAEYRDMLSEFMRGTKRGVAYLPGTKQEVDNINSLIRSNTKTECREGKEASEISLKELSGNSPSILHIATHGFFMTDKAASKVSNSMFGSLGSDALSRGDKSMIRSGILLAGANNTLRGKQNKTGDNDGVLTAKEVSTLDLANTELVVLSACNSAVGDISGEGVYGIQRGFKMAGASSILVTLWEVDDRATQILMTRFYKNLINGSTPNQSVKEASLYLRNYTENGAKPYANPKYWAAFILLDGLN